MNIKYAIYTGFFVIILPVFAAPPLAAAEGADSRPSGLYVFAGPQHYAFPGKPLVNSLPGLRLGGGWELPLGPGSLALGLESGWSYTGLTGDSRPADAASLVSIAFRAGYSCPVGSGFTLRLDVPSGVLLVLAKETGVVPLIGPRVSAEYRLGGAKAAPLWNVYAGFGADFVPQTGGLVTLPIIETGVKLSMGDKK